MTEQDKWIEAIAKIIKLTQEKRLEWESLEPSTVPKKDPNDKIDSVYMAGYKDKTLLIYRRTYDKRTLASTLAAISGATAGLGRKEQRITSIVLELVDDRSFHPFWTFPSEGILADLLSAIKYQVSGVGDFLDDILSEK